MLIIRDHPTFASELCRFRFRRGLNISGEALNSQLTDKANQPFAHRLRDLHSLSHLCQFFDLKQDMPRICTSVINDEVPMEQGDELVIKSVCGYDQ